MPRGRWSWFCFAMLSSLLGAAQAQTSGVAQVVSLTTVSETWRSPPSLVTVVLPPAIVERLLVDYELQGGTYEAAAGWSSQAGGRRWLTEVGVFLTYGSRIGPDGALQLDRPVWRGGNGPLSSRRARAPADPSVKIEEPELCIELQPGPIEPLADGFQGSLDLVVHLHGARYRVTAVVELRPLADQVEVALELSGPRRLSPPTRAR